MTKQTYKPRRGVGSVISRRRRAAKAKQAAREEALREEARRRALSVVASARTRKMSEDDSFAMYRRNAAMHALQVLSTNHRAFLKARQCDVELALRLSNPARSAYAMNDKDQLVAFTDFRRIMVTTPLPSANKALREWVVELRGALHHETGHVRFTTSFPSLVEAVDETFDWRDYVQGDSALHRVWNILEDQRMEAAVVREVPRIASYFIPMVLNVVLDAQPMLYHDQTSRDAVTNMGPWIMVAGRHYLPKKIRDGARRNFDEHAFGHKAEEWSDIVDRYMRATTATDMMTAVLDAQDFINTINYDGGANGTVGTDILVSCENEKENHSAINTTRSAYDAPNEQDEQIKQSASTGEGEDEGDGDGEGSDGNADGDASDDDSSTEKKAGRGSADLRETIEDALNEAMDQAANSSEINYIVNDITSRVESGELLDESPDNMRVMSSDDAAAAHILSRDVVDALNEFRIAKSPAWAFRQEEGYIDPLAYRTREPGERDYRRNVQNWNNNGLGVHVSVLADRSGSMSGRMVALSQTLWAINEACNDLDIPKTMVLWADHSDTNRVLTESSEPEVFQAGGGTCPTRALDDLDNHVENSELHHLIFVFTDGDWMDTDSLANWKRPDRTFVIIGLNCSNAIRNKDADLVIDISSMSQLGPEIRRVLEEYVATN